MEKRRGVIARAVKLPQAGQPGQLPVRLVTGGSGGASEQSTLESAGREQEKHQQYLSWRRRDLGDRSQRRVRAQSAQERGEPQKHHLAPCDSEPPLDLPDTPASAPEPAMSLQRRVMTPERQLSKSLRRSQSLNLRAALAGSGKLRLGASLEPAERADSRGSRPGSKASTVPSVMGSSGGALQLATAAATPAPEEVSEELGGLDLRPRLAEELPGAAPQHPLPAAAPEAAAAEPARRQSGQAPPRGRAPRGPAARGGPPLRAPPPRRSGSKEPRRGRAAEAPSGRPAAQRGRSEPPASGAGAPRRASVVRSSQEASRPNLLAAPEEAGPRAGRKPSFEPRPRLPGLVGEIEAHLQQSEAGRPSDAAGWLRETAQLTRFAAEMRLLLGDAAGEQGPRPEAPRPEVQKHGMSVHRGDKELQWARQKLRNCEEEHERLARMLEGPEQEELQELRSLERDIEAEKRRQKQLAVENRQRERTLEKALADDSEVDGDARARVQIDRLEAELKVWRMKNASLETQVKQAAEALQKATDSHRAVQAKAQQMVLQLSGTDHEQVLEEHRAQEVRRTSLEASLLERVEELQESRKRAARAHDRHEQETSRRLGELKAQRAELEAKLVGLERRLRLQQPRRSGAAGSSPPPRPSARQGDLGDGRSSACSGRPSPAQRGRRGAGACGRGGAGAGAAGDAQEPAGAVDSTATAAVERASAGGRSSSRARPPSPSCGPAAAAARPRSSSPSSRSGSSSGRSSSSSRSPSRGRRSSSSPRSAQTPPPADAEGAGGAPAEGGPPAAAPAELPRAAGAGRGAREERPPPAPGGAQAAARGGRGASGRADSPRARSSRGGTPAAGAAPAPRGGTGASSAGAGPGARGRPPGGRPPRG